jgi:hypothetical protein
MRNENLPMAAQGGNGELGGSKITLTIVLVVLALAIHAGVNLLPVKYNDSDIKQQLQGIATNAVVNTSATTGNNQISWATTELNRLATDYGLPPTAFKAEMAGQNVKTSVKYKRKVAILPFGLYDYEYDLDYSAVSFGGPIGKQG